MTSTLTDDGLNGYEYDQVTVELMEAAQFEYLAPWEFGRCNKSLKCTSGCTENLLWNNPYSYRCLSMSFKARISEGYFEGCEVLVVREFAGGQFNPINGAFTFPGRKCYVSGIVDLVKEKEPFFVLRANRVHRTLDLDQDIPFTYKQKVHRFRGSMVCISKSEMQEQANATFDC